MPKVAKGKRQRAYHSKTQTGCLTCRKRRVKCDERKPFCRKCTVGGRICHYIQPLCPPQLDTGSVLAGPSFDLAIYASPESRRAFAFFMQKTRYQQAGFFGSDFWERLVLQAAYHEPAIRYTIVAIGSLQELLERRSVIQDADKVFALEQYNLGMRDLLLPLSKNRERGVDNIQGNHASAGAHIRSGAKLLREVSYDQRKGVMHHQVLGMKADKDSYVSLDVISRMYGRMCPDISLWIGAHDFDRYERFFSTETTEEVPPVFWSIEEAKNVFEYGRALLLSNLSSVLPFNSVDSCTAAEPDTRHFETMMSRYSFMLQAYVRSRSLYFTREEDIAICVLRLNMLSSYLSIYMEHSPPHKKASWNDFMPHIMEMIELGEKVFSYISTGTNQGSATCFCLDMGTVFPLYTLGIQCGDPTIRRKVIVLLRSSLRQDAFWNSFLVAEAIERIMKTEESVSSGTECLDDSHQVIPLGTEPLKLDGKGGWAQQILRGEI
ncbi:hypothetical protein BP6252_05904 [Coleophoma cylindrospora]|uniref:Zn(2)-C6 fungal-type domain-containing protein n=1 Tax=Coleophoma cylindrospora TaxID=1849047 RepID=A0A3D8RKZ9_9HELO|nr:hypothetical protein BP6252_05904 [Coleophoma cylindrospora]